MTTNEVRPARRTSPGGGAPGLDLRTQSAPASVPADVSLVGMFGVPAAGDELGATDARFLLEADGLACCMTCGLVTRPWVVRLPDATGTCAVVARCVACGTRGTVHSASHWVRVTRAPNPSLA